MSDTKFVSEMQAELQKALGGGRTALTQVNQLKPRVDSLEPRVSALENKPTAPNPSLYVVASWTDGKSGYIKWSNGFIEQYGGTSKQSNDTHNVTLPTVFKNNKYFIWANSNGDITGNIAAKGCPSIINNVKNNGFSISGMGSYERYLSWYACGY